MLLIIYAVAASLNLFYAVVLPAKTFMIAPPLIVTRIAFFLF